MDIGTSFPQDFFEDELREGFYVSNMMKCYWAAQISVMSEIAKVCEKHDIPWYIDFGTLMGAIRHGGYIPWDDDFDICMLREDYMKFFEVAKDELPAGYQVLCLQGEEEYELLLGRIVNGHSINYGEDHLKKYHGCPYTVGVDIFPLDGLAEKEEEEEKRRLSANEVSDAIVMVSAGKTETEECRKLLAKIERKNHVILHRRGNIKRELLLLLEKLYSMYPTRNAKDVALMPFWVSGKSHKYSRDMFQNIVWLNFENAILPAPSRYEEKLKKDYGDYMIIRRAGGIHDYPVYGEQEQMLKERLGGNPFRYTFGASRQTEDGTKGVERRQEFSSYCNSVVGLLEKVHKQMQILQGGDRWDGICQLLEGCQNLAIGLGTELEKRGGDFTHVISLLEHYCEVAYACHEMQDPQELDNLQIIYLDVKYAVTDYLQLRKKRILFLPCRAKWWQGMASLYEKKRMDSVWEVHVMPIPCYRKNEEGEILAWQDDRGEYPKDLMLRKWEDLDFETECFDEIVIQFPYDGCNRSMTIPKKFYSKNLLLYADIVSYVPCFEVPDTSRDDGKLTIAMKTLVEQPAVEHADRIYLSSEWEKQKYLEILGELTGTGQLESWMGRLFVKTKGLSRMDTEPVSSNPSQNAKKKNFYGKYQDKKIFLYHVGPSSLLQYRSRAVPRLRETMREITASYDRIQCVFMPAKSVEEIERINPGLWKEYQKFMADLENDERILVDKEQSAMHHLEEVDAYYGDADMVAHYCRNLGIPVMIRMGE